MQKCINDIKNLYDSNDIKTAKLKPGNEFQFTKKSSDMGTIITNISNTKSIPIVLENAKLKYAPANEYKGTKSMKVTLDYIGDMEWPVKYIVDYEESIKNFLVQSKKNGEDVDGVIEIGNGTGMVVFSGKLSSSVPHYINKEMGRDGKIGKDNPKPADPQIRNIKFDENKIYDKGIHLNKNNPEIKVVPYGENIGPSRKGTMIYDQDIIDDIEKIVNKLKGEKKTLTKDQKNNLKKKKKNFIKKWDENEKIVWDYNTVQRILQKGTEIKKIVYYFTGAFLTSNGTLAPRYICKEFGYSSKKNDDFVDKEKEAKKKLFEYNDSDSDDEAEEDTDGIDDENNPTYLE